MERYNLPFQDAVTMHLMPAAHDKSLGCSMLAILTFTNLRRGAGERALLQVRSLFKTRDIMSKDHIREDFMIRIMAGPGKVRRSLRTGLCTPQNLRGSAAKLCDSRLIAPSAANQHVQP